MVRFTHDGIEINGTEIPLYSGSLHYWRMKRNDWRRILELIKGLGFDIVETYIPWSVHEYEEGKYDFGELEVEKDIDHFLSLCEEMELAVIVRPGPHINAEMTGFGYPEWILMDEEIQARNPWGTTILYPYAAGPFPVPSYASEKLYEKTEDYFLKLKPILQKHCGEKGCICLIQADNETCNFFRDRPYIMDYSDSSKRMYREFLANRYDTVADMNKKYNRNDKSFEEIEPPWGFREGDFASFFYYMDWVEFKEHQILCALRRMVDMIKRLELSVPVFHNCAYQNYTPVSVQRDEEIPGLIVAGIDAYPEPGDTAMLKERIRYLAASSRFPFVPEFGSGSWFDREVLLTAGEERFSYLYSIMNGLKGINFYMLAERDRWTGCPITSDGRIRKSYYDMFLSVMKLLKKEEINRYNRSCRVLILKNYDMGRLKALHSVMDLNMLSSNCFIKGPDIPEELFWPEERAELYLDEERNYWDDAWVKAVAEYFDAEHEAYDYSDEYLSEEAWEKYDVIVAASYDRMDFNMQNNLAIFSRQQGKTVIFGPVIPVYDRDLNPCEILKKEAEQNKNPGIIFAEKASGIGDEFWDCLRETREYDCREPFIEIAVHRRRGEKEPHLLYAANRSGDEIMASVTYKGNRRFTDISGNGGTVWGDGEIRLRLPGYTVTILKAEVVL